MNILTTPIIGALFRRPQFLNAIRFLVLALFASALFFGLIYPDSKGSFTTNLFWGFFWPFLMTLLIPLLGNWFCSVCPHGFIGKYLTRFGLRKRFPRKARTAYIGLAFILLGFWLVTFTLPRFFEESPSLTASFFLLFTVLAFVCFFVYDGMAYCKYVCPLGGVLKSFGKSGISRIETKSEDCSSCRSFDCAVACPYQLSPFHFAERNNMSECTLCLECVVACDSVKLEFKPPMQSLTKEIKKVPRSEAWILILMTAVVGLGVQFQHGLDHTSLLEVLPWTILGNLANQYWPVFEVDEWSGMFAMIIAVILTVTVTVTGCRLAASRLKLPYADVLSTMSFGYTPLVLLALMAHSFPFFLTIRSAGVINSAIEAFNLPFTPTAPLVPMGTPWLALFDYIPYLAVACCFVLLYVRSGLLVQQPRQRLFCFATTAAPIWLFALVLLLRGIY